ncbi:hypothetical protein JCM10450v2_003882 [Rhodotorula kratochvilovae]
MAPHHRARRRSDSDDSTASSSSDGSGSSSSSSGSSSAHIHKKGRRKGHGGSTGSGSSSGSSSSSSDEEELFLASGAILFLVLGVVLVYFLTRKDAGAVGSSGGSSAGSAGGSAGAGAGGATAGGASSSAKPSSKTSGGSASPTKATPASSGDSASSSGGGTPASTGTAADPSNTGPYKLLTSYEGESFFDGWTFWDSADPTHGQVDYVSLDDAKSAGLISTSADSIIMKVDNTTTLDAGAARASVRIHSTEAVKIGSLVIADILKMPYGCSTWPAWWMNGPDWPAGGEIDVLEGVHNDPANQITLHTVDSDCKLTEGVDVTGTLVPANNDCNANVNGNTGCSYAETAENSYGEGFNNAGGGVFATSFTADAIEQWFWSRPDVPENIAGGSPDKATWGKPSASWPSSGCDIGKYFKDQTLIFDTTLCGDWAGAVWKDECLSLGATCSDAVKDPRNYDNAYWEVKYVRVYSVG